MTKTNVENLHVYQLSETLADNIWDIVIKWDSLVMDTVGRQIVRSADSMGQISLRGQAEAVSKTTVVL